MPTLYEVYKTKAIICRENAKRCETEWSKAFWQNRADRLDAAANELGLNISGAIVRD